ncbi:LLM class flavin-dependent oxidoreductase [Bacillus thuringiensis serovar roskildiensis]|uniref:LLM class flavin-dependent oxidoreductase n=1 Tax=Bacillus thuringiensis serovar sooncheon TaxID=180891 RepID=A0A9Q5SK26_BACTU|nr:LLM class flavin-dependent oxidoreductase [Bacillus thuringiensis]OTW64979.1 LLM class flavin-dependent oxidoreductase [Bacillus thuringiensis serovar coreanensis]OTX49191.1 LLM class flavin-dependent oxidoreductase [Bacillus thuringiensis serovar sooncheon]OTX57632.1 LLM class flavin-dependent oxidoreductase [Bacillus thuringiensis serovar guiyangiensis]OTX62713.1 LLM class flavin-dependent oxidoreductase [Bacillus thuringiensis serovar roskildiensis]
MIKLSVLDQSPISDGSIATQAFSHTVTLAQEVEKLGFTRFWVSEHHNSVSLAGSSPEILISHIAAKTERMRVGSGGVMLPHYSPYKVAENFRVLEALYPNRIDLGVGRAPGGMPIATRALQEGKMVSLDQYPEQIADVAMYLHDQVPENHHYANLKATPVIPTSPEMWMLGSSGESAMIAAKQGASFAFAQFINGYGGPEVMKAYQEQFQPSYLGDKPKSIVSIFVICGETNEEAEKIASSLDLSILLLEQGKRTTGTPSIETAQNYSYSAYDLFRIKENRQRMIVGDPSSVKEQIVNLSKAYNTDEFMIVTITHRFEDKLNSYRLLANAFHL